MSAVKGSVSYFCWVIPWLCLFLATYVLVSAQRQPSRGPSTHSWPSDLFPLLWWVESGAACIAEHLDVVITGVHWHSDLSCGNNFAGSGSPVSLGRGPYFLFEVCEASSRLCYQTHWNFFPSLSSRSTFHSPPPCPTPKSYFSSASFQSP